MFEISWISKRYDKNDKNIDFLRSPDEGYWNQNV